MRIKIIAILLLTGFAGFASTPKDGIYKNLRFGIDEFNLALSLNEKSLNNLNPNELLGKHLTQLKKRKTKHKKQAQFVEYTFFYIHNKLLRKYRQYASINETLESGVYDCVTATAVYALFFTELDIPFSVIETNYHIYVLVYPGSKNEILLETTDPVGGFIADHEEITVRKKQYTLGNQELTSDQVNFNWDVENSLKGNDLIGVLLYNQSIKQFNANNKTVAIALAKEALIYYDSKRIKTYLSFIEGNQFASN